MAVNISSSSAVASQAVSEVVGLVGEMSRCSGSLGVVEGRKASRVAEVPKEVLHPGANRLVGLDSQPCSQSTSSDGTPITVSHHVAAELRSGTVYRRNGKLRGSSASLSTCCKSQRTALAHCE